MKQFVDRLKTESVIDLAGATVQLDHPLIVPKGSRLVKNGTIAYAGHGGKVGDGSMAAFNVGLGASLGLEQVHFVIPPKVIAVKVDGGSVDARRCNYDAGCLVWGSGGKSVKIQDCYTPGWADKYSLFCNFDDPLEWLVIDQSGLKNKPICQGKDKDAHEALVRLMQVNDATLIGLDLSAHFKQALQLRAGGDHGDKFASIVCKRCRVRGGVAVGNIEDDNIICGTVNLIRLEECDVDFIHVSDKKYGGFRRFEIAHTRINGRLTDSVIDR